MTKGLLPVLVCLVAACSSTHPPASALSDHGAGNVVFLEPALRSIVPDDYRVEKIDTGFLFTEGPVWVPSPGYLLFSDVPGDTIYKWTPGRHATPFLKPVYTGPPPGANRSIGPNGLTLDGKGNLVFCEHGDRCVSRMPLAGGKRVVLASRYQGKRLNSPNDLVFHSSGDLYFTDPPYGLDKQDASPDKELDFNGVFRLQPDGTLTVLTKELPRPNGIAFSPDEKTLYVANSGPERNFWMAYDVQPDGNVANARVFVDATKMPGSGLADGMKIDAAGNLYCTGPGGVLIFNPAGKHLGTIQATEQPANLAWGDADGKTLYMTARTSLYRIRLKTRGLLPVGVR